MYPVSLDLSRIRIALVGSGEAFARRLKQLHDMGATQLSVHDDVLPEAYEIKQASILMVAGLDYETSAVLASIAKLQGVLVNAEDMPDLCDFHFNSFIKRGDLTIAVSTAGASPALSQEIRSYIARRFGEEWGQIVSAVRKKRLSWKEQGLDNGEVADRTRKYIKDTGLLDDEAALHATSAEYHPAKLPCAPVPNSRVYDNIT